MESLFIAGSPHNIENKSIYPNQGNIVFQFYYHSIRSSPVIYDPSTILISSSVSSYNS